jgi:hypothetical protein
MITLSSIFKEEENKITQGGKLSPDSRMMKASTANFSFFAAVEGTARCCIGELAGVFLNVDEPIPETSVKKFKFSALR